VTDRRFGTGKGEVYPASAARMLLNPLRRLLQFSPTQLADRLELRGDERVLDLGCGPGYYAPEVARRLGAGRLVLFDLQAEMLGRARQRVARKAGQRPDPLAGAVRGDATGLPFPTGAFDVVVLVTVLGEVPDLDDALGEASRVLSSGGLLSVSETSTDPDFIAHDDLVVRAARHGLAHHRTHGRPDGRRPNFTAGFRASRSTNPPTGWANRSA
jgi:ubiquinone/menaquinone biosynthesis C-methylase UbiE